MKQILISIIILASTIHAYSNECIGTSITYSVMAEKYLDDTIMNTDLRIWYEYQISDNLSITPYGMINTWFTQNKKQLWRGCPFLDVYFLGTKFKYDFIGIDLNHFCAHSVFSSYPQWVKYNETYNAMDRLYYIMGANSTKAHIFVEYEMNNLTLYSSVGNIIQDGSICSNNQIMYTKQFGKIDLNISYKHYYFFTEKRSVHNINAEINMNGFYLSCLYSKANKMKSKYTGSFYYGENPVVKESLNFSIGYKFN